MSIYLFNVDMFKTLSREGKPIGWRSSDLALNNYVPACKSKSKVNFVLSFFAHY